MRTIFLNVSEVYITNKHERVKTILGSCLAIILFVPRLHLSAICHVRLPKGKSDITKKNGFCYVDSSLDYMINKLLSKGAKKTELPSMWI